MRCPRWCEERQKRLIAAPRSSISPIRAGNVPPRPLGPPECDAGPTLNQHLVQRVVFFQGTRFLCRLTGNHGDVNFGTT